MKISKISFFETLIAICIIINCESVWRWMNHSGYVRLAVFLCATASLLILILRNGAKIHIRNLKFHAFFTVYLLIFLLYNLAVNSSHVWDVIQITAIMSLFSLYCCNGENVANIMDRVSAILAVLAGMSLVFWIFGSVFHILEPNQSITIWSQNQPIVRKSYFYLHYEIQTEVTFGMNIYRNTSVFCEGPKYALILSLALMYELFIRKEFRAKRCILFTIAALSTISMTGILAVAAIWLLYAFFRIPMQSKRGLFVRFVFIIAFLIIGTQVFGYFENMLSIKSATTSYSTRLDNYMAGFRAWVDHPYMGAGYLNMDTIQSYYSSWRLNDIGYANSIFRVLAQGGVYLFVLYLLPTIKAIARAVRTQDSLLLCYIIMFIYYFVTTSFPYNFIMVLVLCMFWYGSGENGKTLEKA